MGKPWVNHGEPSFPCCGKVMNDVAVHILTRPDPRYPRWIDDPGDRGSAVWGATQNTVGFWAEGLSPPECSSPQVTTDPSARIAENAPWLA